MVYIRTFIRFNKPSSDHGPLIQTPVVIFLSYNLKRDPQLIFRSSMFQRGFRNSIFSGSGWVTPEFEFCTKLLVGSFQLQSSVNIFVLLALVTLAH